MCAFAFGACTGVRMTLISSLAKNASKARGNFASRSWIRNRTRRACASSCFSRLRACWSIQAVFGLLVQAKILDPAAADREQVEHVQTLERDRVDGEEIACEDRLAMRSEEATPRLGVAPRRRR